MNVHTPVKVVGLALLGLLLAAPLAAAERQVIGVVNNAKGTVAILRDGATLPARPGEKLFALDILETGEDGSLGVILRDDSVMSLGPSSRVVIDKFLFSPAEGQVGLTLRILRGTVAYLSGLIGKISPESATFETPVATIGIRGTRFAVRVVE